jgi:hypothetical protein
MQEPAAGMGRFFSWRNLGRYRKPASGGIGQAEQHKLLKDLAEEMDTFRCEARVAAVFRPSYLQNTNGSQAGNQI